MPYSLWWAVSYIKLADVIEIQNLLIRNIGNTGEYIYFIPIYSNDLIYIQCIYLGLFTIKFMVCPLNINLINRELMSHIKFDDAYRIYLFIYFTINEFKYQCLYFMYSFNVVSTQGHRTELLP